MLITSVNSFFCSTIAIWSVNLKIDILSFVMFAFRSALLSVHEIWLNSEYIVTLPVNSTESSSDSNCFKLY